MPAEDENNAKRIEIRLEDLEPEPARLEVVLDEDSEPSGGPAAGGPQAILAEKGLGGAGKVGLARRAVFSPPLALTAFGVLSGIAAWAVTEPFVSGLRAGSGGLFGLIGETALFFAASGVLMGLALGGGEWAVIGAGRKAILGAAAGALAGLLGGAVGGMIGQGVYAWLVRRYEMPALALVFLRAAGWSMVGTWLGLGLGLGERAAQKTRNGLIGGSIGGMVGGAAFQAICSMAWSGPASRLVALTLVSAAVGACMGLVETVAKTAWLEVVSGALKGKQFPVYAEGTLIGSGARCQVVVPRDPSVSEVHATIAYRGGRFVLTDGGSRAQVRVNGRSVRQAVLRDGDVVQVGSTSLRFRQRPQH